MNEASLFARYLGVKTNDAILFEQYHKGVNILNLDLQAKETRAMNTLLRFPFLLAFADAGFAITEKENMIRKRLLLMAALIETNKKYVSLFITNKNTSGAILKFLCRVILAGVKSCIGFVLLKLLRWI